MIIHDSPGVQCNQIFVTTLCLDLDMYHSIQNSAICILQYVILHYSQLQYRAAIPTFWRSADN